MPGIVGIVTRAPRELVIAKLARMAEAMVHEEFYVTSICPDILPDIAVASVEHATSACAAMPVWSSRGDIALMFSGEEFADSEADNTSQRSDKPFGYLIERYESDPAFLCALNGRFHGLVVDKKRERLLLFNDRYGMHRLYFYQDKDAFYFSAEAKAILAVCPELRSMDTQSLGEFLACGAVMENRTIFKGIHLLPPASAWVFENGCISQKMTYFQPSEWEQQEPLQAEDYSAELNSTFAKILPRYFRGNQKIGMALTGGLDTRMILAGHMPAPGALPCYTFSSMFRKNQDARLAAAIARLCQQSHQLIEVGPAFLSEFARYAERAVYLTDGCVDLSRAPDLYLNEKVRRIAPVRLSGTYGGEILRGVQSFKPVRVAQGILCKELTDSIEQAAHTFKMLFSGHHPVTNAAFKQCPWYLQNVLILEQSQVSMRSPFLDNDFVRTVFRSPAGSLKNNDISLRLIRDGNPDLLRIPTDRGVAGDRNAIAGILHRFSLEVLFKAEYAYDMGMPQWLARVDHGLSQLHLEQLFLGRHKVFHFRIWYRDFLTDYVKEMLLDTRSLSRSYIEKEGLERIVTGHLSGKNNYTEELHKVLTLELIQRLLLESLPGEAGMERVHPNLTVVH